MRPMNTRAGELQAVTCLLPQNLGSIPKLAGCWGQGLKPSKAWQSPGPTAIYR